MRFIIFSALFCLCITGAFGIENSMTLLAVSELPNGSFVGGTADLMLELVPGKGRVFIDTYPLTKLDTQVSTRIAKQIACDFLEKDCSIYDFIYTINSGSAIVGGPSAGSSITALTIATLDNQPFDRTVAMSGTINSGGFVGPVSGLKEKIEAAQFAGFDTVLIPKGTRFQADLNNESVFNQTNRTDLIAFGEQIGITVLEVSNIYEVMDHITFKQYSTNNESISLPSFYVDTMEQLASDLCARTDELLQTIFLEDFEISQNQTVTITSQGIINREENVSYRIQNSSIDIGQTFDTILDLLNQSETAQNQEQYYAAASFCYGAGLNARFIDLLSKDISQVQEEIETTFTQANSISSYSTITELQTYMLVKERLVEAQEHVNTAQEHLANNRTVEAVNAYAFALERVNSANAWSQFFSIESQEFNLDQKALRQSCEIKIREAEERKNYVELNTPFLSTNSDDLQDAKQYARERQYELCLHSASKAKAAMDVVLGVAGFEVDQLDEVLKDRAKLTEQIIQRQSQKGIFPIIGYSYYEYGKSLAENGDNRASLLYLQYAIELSNLDVYLPNEIQIKQATNPVSVLIAVLVGLIVFLGLSVFIHRN